MTSYAERLSELSHSLGITGASFAYWDGQELHRAAAGLRNSVTGDPVTLDTVMHIGSITKILNTTLFLQLVDDGLMQLDDPVLRHLPELRLRDMDALAKMTCRMLVNHTNGINCDMLPDHGPDRERIVDLMDRCAELGQLHEPGQGPAYSNLGTCIAGYLVEKLRGRSWYRLMEERVLRPLELSHSLVDISDVPLFRASIGDMWDYERAALVQTARPFLPLSFAPCGTTAMMTAEDLVTFARVHTGGGVGPNGARLLSAEMTDLMTQPTIGLPAMDASWGLGWLLLPDGVLWHGGGGPGVASVLYVHKPSGRCMALLTNCDRGGALMGELLSPIIESWTETPTPRASPAISAPADLTPYVGLYGNNIYQMELAPCEGSLTMRGRMSVAMYDRSDLWSPPATLVPIGPDRFELPGMNGRKGADFLFVEPDGQGRMTKMFNAQRLLVRL